MELVRLHQTEVTTLVLETHQVVQLQRSRQHWIATPFAGIVEVVTTRILAVTTHGPDHFNDGVIEVQLHAHLRAVGLEVLRLHLGNQLLETRARELSTLFQVEIHEGRQNRRVQIRIGDRHAVDTFQHRDTRAIRHLDRTLQGFETNVHRERVELQRHQRQRVTRDGREPPRQRHVQRTLVLGVLHQLRDREAFANHFRQALARLAREFLPHEQIVIGQRVNRLSTNGEARFFDQELTDGIGVVRPRTGQTRARVDFLQNTTVGLDNRARGDFSRGRHTGTRALGGRTVTTRVTRVTALTELLSTEAAGRRRRTRNNTRQTNQNVLV